MRALGRRIVTGDGNRRSRLHDYDGNLLDPWSLTSVPAALWSTLGYKLFGHRAERPWLSYRATRVISGLLSPDAHVLEFGAGMSTLWFAGRVGRVVSYETNAEWFAALRSRVPANVDLRLIESQGLASVMLEPRTFDFALVDCELHRDLAIKLAIASVKAGGYVYLDNCDTPTSDRQLARRLLEDATPHARRFVDFYPTALTVSAGLLAQVHLS